MSSLCQVVVVVVVGGERERAAPRGTVARPRGEDRGETWRWSERSRVEGVSARRAPDAQLLCSLTTCVRAH